MKKDTYLFSEVVIGLRNEYLKNQKLLDELRKYIKISNDKIEKVLFCDESLYNNSNEIFLLLLKRQNNLQKIIDYIGMNFFNSPCNILAPLFSLKNGEYGYNFEFIENSPFKNKYSVEIDNKNEVMEIANELYNSPLIKNENICSSLSDFQLLTITPRNIYMWGRFDDLNISNSNVKYDPCKDIIEATPGVKYGIHLIETYFKTEIPKDIIPVEYRKIIDENLKNYDDFREYGAFEIICQIDKPTELSINEENNGIVLRKKRTLKFYE